MRLVVSGFVLVIVGFLADGLVLLQPAGAVLTGTEVAALLALAALGIAAAAIGGSPWLLATPVAAFAGFRLLLGVIIEVPDDAVIRDAQAGLAVGVQLLGQLAVVGIGLAIAARRVTRHRLS